MIDQSLIKELEQPIELERNIVKKQGFKTLLGVTLGTAIAGIFIWYINKDDLDTAEKHKEALDIEYVDEAGNVIPRELVESNDGTYIPDIDKTPYVDRKVKDRTSKSRRRSEGSKKKRSRR